MRLNWTFTKAAATFGAVLLLTAACGSAGSSGGSGSYGSAGSTGGASAGNASGAVSTANAAGLGSILVDGAGHTLYFTDSETAGSVKCTGDCLGFWKPLTVSAGTTPAGSGLTGMLGKLVRKDAGTQVTYAGHPLYTFALDRSAGQIAGNGAHDAFGGTSFTWHAVQADGSAAGSGGSSSSSAYGRGY